MAPNRQHQHHQGTLLEIQILRPYPDLQILNSGAGSRQSIASQALPVILAHAKVRELHVGWAKQIVRKECLLKLTMFLETVLVI